MGISKDCPRAKYTQIRNMVVANLNCIHSYPFPNPLLTARDVKIYRHVQQNIVWHQPSEGKKRRFLGDAEYFRGAGVNGNRYILVPVR